MIDTILFFVHHTLTLLSGVLLSSAFCGVRFTRRNICIIAAIFLVCGTSQLSSLLLLGEKLVWELYPVIVHLPLGVLLGVIYRKRPVTVIASVSLAYLCCQPSNWIGMLSETLGASSNLVWIVRICVALTVCIGGLWYFAAYIGEIFNKDTRSVLIFSSVPLIYYLFDYIVSIYTDLWTVHYRLASEFLAFFLCVAFVLFCIVYYREHERKTRTERKNQIIEITVQQQAREIEAFRKSNIETSLLRHDMRLLLSNLALSISQNDKETALSLISGYTEQVESASLHRYCQNDTINYILSNFDSKCQKAEVAFSIDLELTELAVDEILFSSILANALDNALNAQAELPEEKRQIKLMLKNSEGKLLLSVRNPFREPPVFAHGLPISLKEGHGYGTQSILYMTEKLGGKCRFSLENDTFLLQIVL